MFVEVAIVCGARCLLMLLSLYVLLVCVVLDVDVVLCISCC